MVHHLKLKELTCKQQDARIQIQNKEKYEITQDLQRKTMKTHKNCKAKKKVPTRDYIPNAKKL
jgi:hypothetical protein